MKFSHFNDETSGFRKDTLVTRKKQRIMFSIFQQFIPCFKGFMKILQGAEIAGINSGYEHVEKSPAATRGTIDDENVLRRKNYSPEKLDEFARTGDRHPVYGQGPGTKIFRNYFFFPGSTGNLNSGGQTKTLRSNPAHVLPLRRTKRPEIPQKEDSLEKIGFPLPVRTDKYVDR
jgi:hypothetical protein